MTIERDNKCMGFLDKHFNWWHVSYIVDYIIVIITFAAYAVLNTVPKPWEGRVFHPDDPTLMYPIKSSILPSWAQVVLCLGVSLLLYVIGGVIKRSVHDFHNAWLSTFQAAAFNVFITDIFKLTGGRYRPYWLTECQPDADGDCTGSVTNDARKSFPSGHSSFAFCFGTLWSLYLAGLLRVFSRRGGESWKAVLVLIPQIGAGFQALSRTIDYHHHFSDILGGALIGLGTGTIVYFMNYTYREGDAWVVSEPKNRRKRNDDDDINVDVQV